MSQDFLIRPMKLEDLPKIIDRFTSPWSTREKTEQQWQTYYLEQQIEVLINIGVKFLHNFEAAHGNGISWYMS